MFDKWKKKLVMFAVWLFGIFILFTILSEMEALRPRKHKPSLSKRTASHSSKTSTTVFLRRTSTTSSQKSTNRSRRNPTRFNIDLKNAKRRDRKKDFMVIEKRNKIEYLKSPNLTFYRACGSGNCSSQERTWSMIIFVKSAVRAFERRTLIRFTWASVKFVRNASFQVVFVVGRTNGQEEKLLNEEHEKYQDILQIDESDDYRHIVYKSLAAMQWTSEQSLGKLFFSNTDDDILVDVWKVNKVVEEYLNHTKVENWPEFPIVCMYEIFSSPGLPDRNVKSKYYISKKRYKWPYWPRFCTGGMYTMSEQVVRQILEISLTTNIVPLEDVWITGVLRQLLGMPKEMIVTSDYPAVVHYEGFESGLTGVDFHFKWSMMYERNEDILTCMCHKPSGSLRLIGLRGIDLEKII